MNELKSNDFLATLVKNPDLSIADLKTAGITSDNSSLLSKEDYKNMPAVVEAFKDDEGKFDEKKFNASYDIARIQYANLADEALTQNIMQNLSYGEDAWFAPVDADYRNDNPIIVINKTPSNYEQGISYLTEVSQRENDLSVRELAQREKVVDFETGEELDYSPNEKAGLFKRFELPTLVLAQWDEDGTHFEDGLEVTHKAGDLKFKNGRPYYETLGNRDIYNKDVLRASDVLTVDGSKWNKFDFFDSDDIHKSAGKVALNLVAKVAPMFIPGVGEIYGYLSAAGSIMRTMPVLGKAINGFITGDNSNEVGQFLSNWEANASRFDSTSSDYGREHLVSFEGLGNLISDTSKQLFQQRAVSTIPVLIQKARGVKDFNKVSNLSRNLALSYMAATSAQEVYGDFKQAGATDAVAGLGMLGSTLALYKLMNIDYFRNNLFKDTFMDESEVRAALRGASKETADRLAKAASVTTEKEAASFVNRFSNFYHDTLLKGLTKKGIPGLINRGLSEGTEEVMEEITTDLIKGVTEGLNALGIPVSEDNNLDFGWSAKDFTQRYLMSLAGGFIGGMVFAGQGAYEKWLNTKLNHLQTINPSDMEKLVYYIANGKRGEIDSYLDAWHDKGILGSKDLSIDGEIMHTLDGKSEFIPSTTGISQNDAVYRTIKNTLDTLQQAIESEVDSRFLTPEGYAQLITLGYNDEEIKNNPQLIGASALVALKDYSNFQNDLYDNLTDIVTTKVALEDRIKTLSEDKPAKTEDERKTQASNIKKDAEIKRLQEKLKTLREEKDKFFQGKKNRYYSGQAFFAANKSLHKNFIDLSIDSYTKLKYGRNFKSFNENQKKDIQNEYNEYSNKEGRKNIYKAYDFYLDLSKKFASVIQEHGEDLDKLFTEGKTIPTILGISDFMDAQAKYHKLKIEKLKLDEIEEDKLTEEQTKRKVDIEAEMTKLAKQFTIMMANPTLANISPKEDSAIDVFTKQAAADGRISIYDDSSAGIIATDTNTKVTTDATETILDSLRKQYKSDVNTGAFRFDDGELTAFYKGIASSYQRTGGAEKRLDLFISDIQANKRYVDDEGEYLQEVAERLELDPNDPKWIVGRADSIYPALTRAADNLVQSLGTDNAAAIKYYQEILNILKTNTKLLEPNNEEYLNDFLSYLIPTIKGKSIIDIIKEFDDYIGKINYSAFLDVAAKIGTDVNNLNLLQLVQAEAMNLSNSNRLDEYLIRNTNISDSLNSKTLIPIFNTIDALLQGAADGTNAIINNFKFKENDEDFPKLAQMSEKAAKYIIAQGNELRSRIEFLKRLADTNKARSLRIHKTTALNMRPKWIKSILDIADSIKSEFGIDVKELWGSTELKPTEDNFNEWEKKCIEFEQALYEEFNKLYPNKNDKIQIKELADKLLNLVNKSTLYQSPSTLLTDDKDATISEIDLIYHLATIASLPSKDFYSAYGNTIIEHNKTAENKLAPVYGQEYAIKQIIGQTLNPGLFNAILDGIANNADYKDMDDKFKAYNQTKSRLHNLSVVLGSAGAGKTVGVIKTILDTIIGSQDSIDVIFLAKEIEQAEKVRDAAGFDKGAHTVDDYCQITFGEKVSNYKKTPEDHMEADSSVETKGSVFDKNAKLKLVVIDEVETLSEAELARISADAEDNNVFIIGAGDLKQPGTNVQGFDKNEGKQIVHSSGIEDCLYVKTPTLTTSMRSQTIAKVENTKKLGDALDAVINEAQQKPEISLKERAALVTENLKDAKLYYWENPKTGELSGDMGVTSQEELDLKIKTLSALDGTVAIISDHVGDYNKYAKDGKVMLVPYEKRAGGEYDYVIVDVDFAKHDSRDGSINAYLLAQDFYTLTQRSRRGTVIKTNDATSMFKFVPDENKQQSIKFDESEIKSFTEWRLKSLEDNSKNPIALSDVLENSPLVKGYSGEKSPQPTPAPNPKPSEVPPTPAPVAMVTRDVIDRYFNPTKDDPIKTGEEMITVIVNSFPYAKDDLRKLLKANHNRLTTAEALADMKNSISRSIRKIIQKHYGDVGANAVSTMLINPAGLNPDMQVTITSLKPVEVTPSKNGKVIRPIEKGDKIGYNDALYKLIDNDDFYTWSFEIREGVGTFKDIRTVFPGISTTLLKTLTKKIGSEVRTGFYTPEFLSKISTDMGYRRTISSIFNKGQTQTWIVPYKDDLGLVVSRHYSNDGSKYFDIPLLIISNPTVFGQYTGTIDVVQQFKLEKLHDKHISISDFKSNNSNVIVNSKMGIIQVKEEGVRAVPGVNQKTSDYLKRNNGKVMVSVTDEPAIASHFFDDGPHGIYRTEKETGNSVRNRDRYDFMGVQCIATVEQILDVLKKYRELEGTFKEDVTDTVSSDNIDLLKNDEGKIRQILPFKRAGILLTQAALVSKSVRFNLINFLNNVHEGTGKGGDKFKNVHMMRLSGNGSEFDVANVDGFFTTGHYNGVGEFIPDPLSKLQIEAKPDNFDKVLTTLFGENVIPITQVFAYNYNIKKGSSFSVFMSPNKQLSMFLSELTNPTEIQLLNEMTLSNGAIHGIYLDDKAKKESVAQGSYYGILDPGTRTYYTDVVKVANYTHYAIHVDSNTVIPSDVAAKPTITLNSFIEQNHLGIQASTIVEANQKLADKAVDWRSQYIIEVEGGYELKTHGNENFNNWLKERWNIDANVDENIAESILDTSNNEFSWEGSLIWYKDNKGQIEIAYNNKAGEITYPLYGFVPDEYIASKFFENITYNQEKILNLISKDLKLAEKIVIFEDQFEC